jgi:hypothetical protein
VTDRAVDIDALLRQAKDAVALPVTDLAAQRHGLHALLCRLASAYDQSPDEGAAAQLEGPLRELGAALDRAAAQAEAPPPSFRTRARLARRPASAHPPPHHARELHAAHELASSALGRALRSTATGMLVERVDRLVESAERILTLPALATRPREREAAHHFEVQLSALKRIRNALAVAQLDAEKIRTSTRPLSFLLVGSLEVARAVLMKLEQSIPIFEAWAAEAEAHPPEAPPSGPRPRRSR